MLSSATLQPSNPAISTTSAAICRGLVVLKDAAFSISWTFFPTRDMEKTGRSACSDPQDTHIDKCKCVKKECQMSKFQLCERLGELGVSGSGFPRFVGGVGTSSGARSAGSNDGEAKVTPCTPWVSISSLTWDLPPVRPRLHCFVRCSM